MGVFEQGPQNEGAISTEGRTKNEGFIPNGNTSR